MGNWQTANARPRRKAENSSWLRQADGNSERVFVALALVFALLFYLVSRTGFDGLIYRMGIPLQLQLGRRTKQDGKPQPRHSSGSHDNFCFGP